jgi:Uma2 family endonuclease
MSYAIEEVEAPPLEVQTSPVIQLDDEALFRFCQINSQLRIERTAEGNLIIMSPEGGSSGLGNSKLNQALENWSDGDGTGRVFGPSAGFILPNKAMRAPDVSWVLKERLARLTKKEMKKFLPLCPDFVLELRSESDSLSALKAKMAEYVGNGARLGWLLDPVRKQAHIYRPKKSPEILTDPAKLSGEPVLKGFVLDLRAIWAAMEGD